MYVVAKAVVSTLIAIASKDGLPDSSGHRVLHFLDRRGIANLDANRFSLFSLDLAGQSIV